jgi:hypothetical protein
LRVFLYQDGITMRYYIDCEFNGFGGDLISFAIVKETGESLYFARNDAELSELRNEKGIDPWVEENVLPILWVEGAMPKIYPMELWGHELQRFISGDNNVTIIADWPEDISHLMNLMLLAPGRMIGLPAFNIELRRVDAYYSNLEGAVRHNALWDARSLCHLFKLEEQSNIHQLCGS